MVETDNLECDCCVSGKNVDICPLDNCSYPLCKNCKKIVFKDTKKCPSCRREVEENIKIEILDENIDNLHRPIFNSCYCIIFFRKKLINYIKYILKIFLYFIIILLILFILTLIGRVTTTVLGLYINDFWLESYGVLSFLYYLLYSFLGILILCFFVCLAYSCLCVHSEDDSY